MSEVIEYLRSIPNASPEQLANFCKIHIPAVCSLTAEDIDKKIQILNENNIKWYSTEKNGCPDFRLLAYTQEELNDENKIRIIRDYYGTNERYNEGNGRKAA